MGEPFIFIDATFYCFYRYGATKTWYTNHTKIGEEEDCHAEHEGFMTFYQRQFNSTLEKIRKKFKSDNVYWFADSPRETLWRMPHHDEYKASRGERGNEEIGPVIKWSYRNLIPSDRVIRVATAEADDCLAIAAFYERAQNPTQKIYVITGDSDYLQLVDDHLEVINPKGNAPLKPMPLRVKSGKNWLTDLNAQEYLLMKILMGDKTDEIPQVYAGCGPATAYQLARNPEKLAHEVLSKPERNEIFERNKTLISFEEIPEELKDAIRNLYLEKRVPPKVSTLRAMVSRKPKVLPAEKLDLSEVKVKSEKPVPPKLNLAKKAPVRPLLLARRKPT